MGANAIQLAVASGYEVVTTCSPHNFGFVKKLGANEAFDYKKKNVVEDIVESFGCKDCTGALAIGTGSVDKCIDVVARCKSNKFVSMASPSVSVQPHDIHGLVDLV